MNWIKPKTHNNPVFPYQRSVDQDAPRPVRHKVVIIGSGPAGLTAALDLAGRNIPSVILTKSRTVSVGSRAICFAKKTLEAMNRLNLGDKMLEKGVVWNLGKVFYDEELVYEFNLLPEQGHKTPAFINLQQYHFEEYLVNAVHEHPMIDIRWEEEMVHVEQDDERAAITVHTPEGHYQIEAEYMLACDGVHSKAREILGIPFEGEKFEEYFLISDITMENDFPAERWFWFDPPFNRGYSALLHKQPDGVWRIDLQLGREVDKEKEMDPERIKGRLRRMLGEKVKFELEWTSIYQFRCARIQQFVHNRILFAGDAAHMVSPFGARGANSGIQDAENLAWKLAYVLQGKAPKALLQTYDAERAPAADENILHSTNATNFISPGSEISLQFRNAALGLAKQHAYARTLINSGRLSHPFRYVSSPLVTPDASEDWDTGLQAGYAFKDAVLKNGFLLDHLGNDFTLLVRGQVEYHDPLVKVVAVTEQDTDVIEKYDLKANSWYLLRPDQHIAARGRQIEVAAIQKALQASLRKSEETAPARTVPELFSKYQNDEKYKMLIDAHKDHSASESELLNRKLILMLIEKVSREEFEEILQKVIQ